MNHGPYETYYENGQVQQKGTFNFATAFGLATCQI